MKVIGIASDSYNPTYVVTVEHRELERYLGLYYSKPEMQKLRVNDFVDLGKGFDYAQQIASAMQKTQEFVGAHQQVVTAILNGLNYQRIVEGAAASETAVAVAGK
jgi:hypothetical protein